MRLKTLDVSLLALMILPILFVGFANAIPPFPNLPSGTVNLTLSFCQDEDQYDIISILSNVPSGFDVINGAYTGWCVDYRGNGVPTSDPVYLYSSTDLPAIAPLHMQDWNRINYILNHVDPQATSLDIQQAIWSFVELGGPVIATRSIAMAMVADADANGENFVPTKGQTVAVVCFPPTWDTEENLQITIIQLLVTKGNGKVTGGGQCVTEDSSEIPAASFGFNAMWFSRDPAPKGELNYVDHTTGMHVHIHELTYLRVHTDQPGNKPWALRIGEFGGPCTINGVGGYFADVYVEDHGEPGADDQFKITLSNGYVGGSDSNPILAGNIQIHKPPK